MRTSELLVKGVQEMDREMAEVCMCVVCGMVTGHCFCFAIVR